ESSVNFTLGANVEDLILTGNTDISGVGNDLSNSISGNGGANTLTGNAGNDTLIGNAGNDFLDGGAGNDTMDGGAGDDTFVVDSLGDIVIEAIAGVAGGNDTVRTSVAFSIDGTNIENLIFTGTGPANGTGNSGDNTLIGNDGDNVLSGGAGNDFLDGQGGNDILAAALALMWGLRAVFPDSPGLTTAASALMAASVLLSRALDRFASGGAAVAGLRLLRPVPRLRGARPEIRGPGAGADRRNRQSGNRRLTLCWAC
ncbi:MAG: calcium-binding protein, partial [Rhodospirillales bacterium]|nr:calcium-binding protein [Rhodospirillales bacterium]